MPYLKHSGRMETARSIGHVPLVENELIQSKLASYRFPAPTPGQGLNPDLLVISSNLPAPTTTARWAMAFDGSPQEVPAREEYPCTRVGYLQIAGVLVHLEEMLGQATNSLVDPTVVRDSFQEALHSIVLPGSNVCRPDMPTVRDSWRAEVFEIFRDYRVEDLSFLDTFRVLINHSDKRSTTGGVIVARCPNDTTCNSTNIDVPFSGGSCPSCSTRVFPTDSLRVHEEVSEQHGNETALGRLMTVLEQVTMASYLLFLSRRRPEVLGQVALILDGPLAIFGPQAWLRMAFREFINAIYADLSSRSLNLPVIVGVEKTGQFADHANSLAHIMPAGGLLTLPESYINDRILASRPPTGSYYGRDTYYGQKFIYKTRQDKILVITIPKTSVYVSNPHDPVHYPILSATLNLLDRIGTSLYENAIIPVALAHSFASIPLRTGSRVLTLMSREILGSSNTP